MSSRVTQQEKAEADKARKWLEDTLGAIKREAKIS